jgi:segregation and condensation protein B
MSLETGTQDLAPDAESKARSIVEALLTAADEPVSAARLSAMLSDSATPSEVAAHIQALNEDYIRTGRAFRITEVAGGFQFTVHPEFAPWVRALLDAKAPSRLSQAALESLAIIAFKQPITKAELEHLRGVNVDGVLRHLMEKGLVRISGRGEGLGRPLLYGTARDFLKFFGLNSLGDLPKLREVEELMKEEEQQRSGLRSIGEPKAEAAETPAPPAQGGVDGKEDGEGATEPVSGPGGRGVEEGV